MSTRPTDAEISSLYAEQTGFDLSDSPAALLDFARAVLAKWGSPQPVVREPMTRDQVKAIMVEAGYDREAPQPRADFINGLRHGERHHGITKGGQHGAE